MTQNEIKQAAYFYSKWNWPISKMAKKFGVPPTELRRSISKAIRTKTLAEALQFWLDTGKTVKEVADTYEIHYMSLRAEINKYFAKRKPIPTHEH